MHTPTTPVSSIHATLGAKNDLQSSSAQATIMRNAYVSNMDVTGAGAGGGSVSTTSTAIDSRGHIGEAGNLDETTYHSLQQQHHHTNNVHSSSFAYGSLRQTTRTDNPQPGTDIDYESTVRASNYGRRLFPSYDPANIHQCPIKFTRQFEHAAQHNGLSMKAWAKRFNSCLFGRAEDWAFEECPLELAGSSWDTRKRQFLDWALLPAEQELRRQRLLRFFQTEADLSIDFVYSFEEAARGLRDYKEDVWVRKCIANLLPPLRSALFELWPDGLPVRFRDLRDSLYAVDWNLYEAASTPLKVVRHGTPYAYEAYSRTSTSSSVSSPRQHTASRNSLSSSNERPQTNRLTLPLSNGQNLYSPPAPMPTILPTRKKRSALSTSVTFHNNRNGTGTAAAVSGRAPTSSSNEYSHMESSDGPSNKVSGEMGRTSGANAGASDLLNALSRIPEKERSTIMAALEKLTVAEDGAAAGDDISMPVTPTRMNGNYPAAFSPMAVNGTLSPNHAKQNGRLATMSPPSGKQIPLKPSTNNNGSARSRAAAAAAAAASAHITSTDGISHRFHHVRAHTTGAAGAADSGRIEDPEIVDISNNSPSLDGSSGSADSGSNSSSARQSGEVAVGGIAADSTSKQLCEQIHSAASDRHEESATYGIGPVQTRGEPRSTSGQQSTGKIRLRTRPLTSIACCSRPQSSPAIDLYDTIDDHEEGDIDLRAIESAESTPRGLTTRTADADATIPRQQMHARKLSSRKSDSALTTATRSMRAAERAARYRDSVDNPMRSPEFTVVHPAIDLRPPHTRRGRFAFIKKLSHMLTPHHQSRERAHQVGA
ncbi:hypothetical protein IW140_001920 [Coemansia sp. RSA 1813]|nr:hypothetical protein EV178_006005 [Coemansia sp. RSA 1646]KAJ1767108.1 hypothetical protein LPJ74_005537 [Coemansia sp. RSA 1843]KAJ2089964.1 hypothetical protein IW138_003094 [Coemansia sp. RSA 986]KAJ2215280.1 hypothetical protein EV179_002368 [Coemansia sp. RSA 487]KAJ2570966.1 hypothetical protein IW140_001920 [Coemansia sp. RSA 1813]